MQKVDYFANKILNNKYFTYINLQIYMIKQHMKIVYMLASVCVSVCLRTSWWIVFTVYSMLTSDSFLFIVTEYLPLFFFTNFKNTQASLNHIIPIIDCMQLSGKRLSDFNLHTNIICFWHTVLTILFTTRSMKWALIVRARKYINK